MSVYVDEIKEYDPSQIKQAARKHGCLWCHLIADSRDELIRFGVRIGLSPTYLQVSINGTPHFDLTPSKRILAIAKGAKAVTRAEFVDISKRIRENAL